MITEINKHKKLFAFLLAIGSIFLFLSYIPNIYEASFADKLPADRIMIWGEHIYTYDYNVYLSKIRQGQEGRFTTIDKYDNNSLGPGVALQMLYLLSGKITAPFNLSPTLTFHLLRTVLSLFWIGVMAYLCMYFLKTRVKSFFAMIVSLLSASFPVFYNMEGQTWWGIYMSWWQEMDVVRRISYLPHYMANYSILAILTILLTLYTKTGEKKYFYWIAILLFFSFFIHPAGGLVFMISWFLYELITRFIFEKPSKSKIIATMREGVVLAISALIPLLYINHVTSAYPWKSLVDFDTTNPLPFALKDYILSLGPVFITGIAGLLVALWKKNTQMLVLGTWVLAAAIGLILFTVKPIQSPVRFVQTANHVPLALLSVYLVSEITKKIKKPVATIFFYGLLMIIPVIGLIQSCFSLKGQTHFIRQRAYATQPAVPYPSQVMYPLKDFYFAIEWLRLYTKPENVVLSKITAGNYIPAYAGNFVYLGHNPETPHFLQREQEIKEFFTFIKTEDEARQFLKERNISYIFYGPQEKEESGGKIPPYTFLKPVYSSFHVVIYKVVN